MAASYMSEATAPLALTPKDFSLNSLSCTFVATNFSFHSFKQSPQKHQFPGFLDIEIKIFVTDNFVYNVMKYDYRDQNVYFLFI